jgi:hypothetical protein
MPALQVFALDRKTKSRRQTGFFVSWNSCSPNLADVVYDKLQGKKFVVNDISPASDVVYGILMSFITNS